MTDLIAEATENDPQLSVDDVVKEMLTYQGQAPTDEVRDNLLESIRNPASYLSEAIYADGE